jgi:hypothetical protein
MGTNSNPVRKRRWNIWMKFSLAPGALRFETTAEAADDEGKTVIDLNVDELRAKYGNADPFRTQYD